MAGTQSTPPQSPVQQGETPSPLCNYLLGQVRLRLDGGISAADLKAAARDAIKSLDQAREQTLANLERDGVKDDVLEAFEKSFEDMQTALEEIDGYAGEANAETHERVRDTIFRAATATATAVTVMQQAQLSEGPTDMPLFNGLFRMKEGYLQGGVEGRQLQEALINIVNLTKAAIQELLAGDGEQPPQRDGLVRAYEEQIESLERVGETIDAGSKDKAQVDDAFEQLLRTSNAVKEAMASLNEALMSKGPCRLTRTNVVLSASETFRTGGISPDQFARTLDGFEAELKEEQAAVNELAGLPSQSEAVRQEVAQLRGAYELHEEALSMFSEFLDGEAEPEDFTRAQKLLVEASEKLSDHKEELERLGESEGKVSCIRCGKLNEPGNRVCGSCGAQMPQQPGLGGISSTMSFQEDDGSAALREGDLVITTNLERLFNAVNEVAENRCSDADFERVLDWMDGLMETAISTMPQIPDMTPPTEASEETRSQIDTLKEELAEQRSAVIEGMTTIRDALATMQGFLESREKDVLVQGVREVRDGAVKMQNAEKALNIITAALKKTASVAAAARGEALDDDDDQQDDEDDQE
jgi:tetratricopeptide (TPR) repeat protein